MLRRGSALGFVRVATGKLGAAGADFSDQAFALDLLERKHAEHFLTSKRSFEYFQAKKGADWTFRTPSPKTITALAMRSGWFFSRLKINEPPMHCPYKWQRLIFRWSSTAT